MEDSSVTFPRGIVIKCENKAAGKASPIEVTQMTDTQTMMTNFGFGPLRNGTRRSIAVYLSKLRTVSVKTETPTDVSCLVELKG